MHDPAINDLIQSLLSERSSLQHYQSIPLRHDEFRAQMFCTRLKELCKKLPREMGIPAIFDLFAGDEGKILQFLGNPDETDDETQSRFEQSLSDLLDAINLSVNKLRSLRRQTWDSEVVDISQTGSALEMLEQLILDLHDLYESVYPSDPALLLANDLQRSLPEAFSRIPYWDQRASKALSDHRLTATESQLTKDQLRTYAYQDSQTLKTAIANRKRVLVACVSEIAAHPEGFFPKSIMQPNRQLTSKPSESDATESPPSIGILTIIGPEMDAVKAALSITEHDRAPGNGTLSYEKVVDTEFNGPIRVLLSALGEPGNTASAIDAAILITRGIRFLLLGGIAAGVRDKVKIGDVVIPRAIVDTTLKVFEDGKLKGRPLITNPLKGVLQMNASARISLEEFHARISQLNPPTIKPPKGKKREYNEHVATSPSVHESAILTDNILHRDPRLMLDAQNDLHQQIRAGEMEAGGFVHACISQYPPIPWFIVRGISDFGDTLKNDLFHDYASKAMAAYLSLYLTRVLDLRIWQVSGKPEDQLKGKPQLWLSDLIQQVGKLGDSSLFPALDTAFTVTFAYLSQLQIPDAAIDPATRVELSILWSKAASEVQFHDEELYRACFQKSAYWADPSRWHDEDIKFAGLSYRDMLNKVQMLGYAKHAKNYILPNVLQKEHDGRGAITPVLEQGLKLTNRLVFVPDGLGYNSVSGFEITHANIEIAIMNSGKDTARDLEADLIETDSFSLRDIRNEPFSKDDPSRNYSRSVSAGKGIFSFRAGANDRVTQGGRLGFAVLRVVNPSAKRGSSIEIAYRIRADKFPEAVGSHVVAIDDVVREAVNYLSQQKHV